MLIRSRHISETVLCLLQIKVHQPLLKRNTPLFMYLLKAEKQIVRYSSPEQQIANIPMPLQKILANFGAIIKQD